MINDLLLSFKYDEIHNKKCMVIRDIDPYTGQLSKTPRTISGALVENMYHILTGKDIQDERNEH